DTIEAVGVKPDGGRGANPPFQTKNTRREHVRSPLPWAVMACRKGEKMRSVKLKKSTKTIT
ncbi:MAG TPA: hypothetical protein VJC18_02390, partial [bacterium]|nr:hypothetical protein [bacterium]